MIISIIPTGSGCDVVKTPVGHWKQWKLSHHNLLTYYQYVGTMKSILNKITGCVIIFGHIPAVVVMFGVVVDVKYSVGTER